MMELNRSYGNLSIKEKEAYAVLCDKQNNALSSPTNQTYEEEAAASARWQSAANDEEKFLKQKAKIHWLRVGDQNNKFFHKIVEARKSRNAIRVVQLPSGEISHDPLEIKTEAVRFFEELFQKPSMDFSESSPADIHDLTRFQCSQEYQDMLTKAVSSAEIRSVLFSMPSNRSPGPDGYTAEFFKGAWPVIRHDFVTAIQSFFTKGFLPKGINSTILTLVQKKIGALAMKDYRPISCCNTMYKVITKILANRLKEILPVFIRPNQSGFIKGRLLLENVLLASELVHGYHLNSTSSRCAIKLDISKAFDSIQWPFITSALRALNIPETFVHWIYLCISSASFSIQVNGELTGFFQSTRGLRQGCPLSPYLFVIGMNVLSALVDRSAANGSFGYHPKCQELGITHLCFADDIMVFSDGSPNSIEGIVSTFDNFSKISGLRINMEKSCLYLAGTNRHPNIQGLDGLHFKLGTLPIRYLGLPLMTTRMSPADCKPLIEMIRHKITSWSSKLLSFAGRMQLISSVISGITNFWAAAFRLPRHCLHEIQKICSSFLWSGTDSITTKAKITWKDLCLPKDEGGLGFRLLQDVNVVYGLKLIWKILEPNTSLWGKWVRHHLLGNSSLWSATSAKGSWIWRKVLKLRSQASTFTKWVINKGDSISFWFDNWSPLGRLIDLVGHSGPRSLGLPLNSTLLEAQRIRNRSHRHRNENLARIDEELAKTRGNDNSEAEDSLLWRHGPDKYSPRFAAKQTWEQIRQRQQRVTWFKGIWFRYATPKYAFVSWLAINNRLSTLDRIAKWSPSTPTTCCLCSTTNESRDHLFFSCPFTKQIWTDLARCLMGDHFTTQWQSLTQHIAFPNADKEKLLLLRLIFQSAIYFIWRERNNRRHNTRPTHLHRLSSDIDKSIRNKLLAIYPPGEDQNTALNRWLAIRTLPQNHPPPLVS